MQLTIILLSMLLTIMAWVIINLLKKLEKYEDNIEEYEKFIDDELKRNEALLEALRLIDSREMFEKDDEVGSIFYQIKETIERFKKQKNGN
jgi:hypothetical protein